MEASLLTKLVWNLPWLVRYPWARGKAFLEQTAFEKKHIIITIADHFEPAWSVNGPLDHQGQIDSLLKYRKLASSIGGAIQDVDGTKFRHTNFYPAEQYDPEILDLMSEMQADGLGEVEVHLHHGVDRPDTAENLRESLVEFRDTLADRHKCLSKIIGSDTPMYAFVHGNLALANSCGGQFCGVDEEMQILADTGCYADMTLPSAPERTQVAMLNQIYECSLPLDSAVPHAHGTRVSANGTTPSLPLIFTGPLVFNWTRRVAHLPLPRLDDGALAANQPLDLARFKRWKSANVTVAGRPDWIFVKLYCHGFFGYDQDSCIGERAKQFFDELIETGAKSGSFDVHFASAREAFNMVWAAIDGRHGKPGEFRNYRLRSIMDNGNGR